MFCNKKNAIALTKNTWCARLFGFYNLEMPVLFLWYVIQLNKDAR